MVPIGSRVHYDRAIRFVNNDVFTAIDCLKRVGLFPLAQNLDREVYVEDNYQVHSPPNFFESFQKLGSRACRLRCWRITLRGCPPN